MNAPLYPNGAFGDLASLGVALAVGIAFGILLEQAGFGSARKLTSQFYLDDLAVAKVMATAMATALVGVAVLSALGVLDRSSLYLAPTLVGPQIVGGVLFGVGFVVGGYCPGTSVVGAVTGRLDALVFLGGSLLGAFLFGESLPWFEGFHTSGDLGELTLPDLLHLPYGVAVALAAMLLIGGAVAAGRFERRAPAPDGSAR